MCLNWVAGSRPYILKYQSRIKMPCMRRHALAPALSSQLQIEFALSDSELSLNSCSSGFPFAFQSPMSVQPHEGRNLSKRGC